MLKKRIIPCLDIHEGRTVKGVRFVDLRDAGDPVALAARYTEEGADELVFLDISATVQGRRTFAELAAEISAHIRIPFTVGGGIREPADVERLLRAGADKISVNSAAVRNPGLLDELARLFGSQCVVLAVDAGPDPGAPDDPEAWRVHLDGGRTPTGRDPVEWIREAESRGAGEVLLTSMRHDGSKSGFALSLTRRVGRACRLPVIASGGAGTVEHFVEVFDKGEADAALAASIFHYGEVPIPGLKADLRRRGVAVRMPLGADATQE